MRKKVYEMTIEERHKFEDKLTFDLLDDLDKEEAELLDQDIVREIILEEEFCNIEDAITYKEYYGVELNDEEEEFLEWGARVDEDLGLPLMSAQTIANL